MIYLSDIRTELIKAIKQSGLSQTELAQKLNIKQQNISQYLNGKSMPALDTFANLCKILDINPSEILCIDKENK